MGRSQRILNNALKSGNTNTSKQKKIIEITLEATKNQKTDEQKKTYDSIVKYAVEQKHEDVEHQKKVIDALHNAAKTSEKPEENLAELNKKVKTAGLDEKVAPFVKKDLGLGTKEEKVDTVLHAPEETKEGTEELSQGSSKSQYQSGIFDILLKSYCLF